MAVAALAAEEGQSGSWVASKAAQHLTTGIQGAKQRPASIVSQPRKGKPSMNSKESKHGSPNSRYRHALQWGTSKHSFYEIEKVAGPVPAPFVAAHLSHTPWSTSTVLEISDGTDVVVTMDQAGLTRHMDKGGQLPLGLVVMCTAVQAREAYEAVAFQGITTYESLFSALIAMQRLDQFHEALQKFRPRARLEQAQIALRHGELAARAHDASLAHPEWDLGKLIAEGEMPLNAAAVTSLISALMELTKLELTGAADYAAARDLLGELAEDLPADFSAKTIGVKLRGDKPGAQSTDAPRADQ